MKIRTWARYYNELVHQCLNFFTFCQVLQVPNLETGKFEPLITGDDNGALTKDEEMQFRNMVG